MNPAPKYMPMQVHEFIKNVSGAYESPGTRTRFSFDAENEFFEGNERVKVTVFCSRDDPSIPPEFRLVRCLHFISWDEIQNYHVDLVSVVRRTLMQKCFASLLLVSQSRE